MIKSFKEFLVEWAVTDKNNIIKGRSILYHNTKCEQVIDILQTNKLIGNTLIRRKDKNFKGVSFTRDFSFHYNTIKIVFDKEQLVKNNYKFKPYDYYYDEYQRAQAEEDEDAIEVYKPLLRHEREEVCIGTIAPVIPYIKIVLICVDSLLRYTKYIDLLDFNEFIELLRELKIPYGFIKDNKILDNTYIEEFYKIIKPGMIKEICIQTYYTWIIYYIKLLYNVFPDTNLLDYPEIIDKIKKSSHKKEILEHLKAYIKETDIL